MKKVLYAACVAVLFFFSLRLAYAAFLPSGGFYFLKDFGRSIERLLTFSAVSNAILEVRFADHSLRELHTLSRAKDINEEKLEKAIDRYKSDIKRANSRFESIKNPKKNEHLKNLLDVALFHAVSAEDFFEFPPSSTSSEAKRAELYTELSRGVSSLFIRFDSPEALRARFKKIGDRFPDEKEIYILEALASLEERLPSNFRETILETRADLIIAFEGRVKARGLDSVSSIFSQNFFKTPYHLKLFDEIREEIRDPAIKSKLNLIRQEALGFSKKESGIDSGDAERMLAFAERSILLLQEKLASGEFESSRAVEELFTRAKFHLEGAKTFYADGAYGQSVGQATAATAEAENGITKLLRENKREEKNEELRLEFDVLKTLAKEKGFVEKNQPALFTLFDSAEHLIIKAVSEEALRDAEVLLVEIEIRLKEIEN